MSTERRDKHIYRCSDCSSDYEIADQFPDINIEFDGGSELPREDRDKVLYQLIINLGTFLQYASEVHNLEAKSIRIEIEIKEAEEEKAYEA